jgi:hypothetical protein
MGWPREQVLNVSITFQRYGPGKPSSRLSTKAWLFPTASLAVVGEKLDTDPWINQPSCSGALLLGGSESVQIYWWLRERLLYMNRVRYIWLRVIRGLSMGSVWCVGRVFCCRMYINLNRHDSRIWVSLVCDNHHVANLINLMRLMKLMLCCFT